MVFSVFFGVFGAEEDEVEAEDEEEGAYEKRDVGAGLARLGEAAGDEEVLPYRRRRVRAR